MSEAQEPDHGSHEEPEIEAAGGAPEPELGSDGDTIKVDGTDDGIEGDGIDDPGPKAPAQPVTVTLTANQIGIIGGVVVVIIVVLIAALLAKGGGSSSTSNGDSGLVGSADAAGATTTAVVKKRWPAEVGGRPAPFGDRGQAAGDPGDAQPGLYLWNDFDGWHLWVVQGDGIGPVSGTITSTADVTKAVSALPDDPGASIQIDGKTIRYDFSKGTAPVQGVDFNPGFRVESLTVVATGAGGSLPADSFHVGKAMAAEPLPYTVSLVDG